MADRGIPGFIPCCLQWGSSLIYQLLHERSIFVLIPFFADYIAAQQQKRAGRKIWRCREWPVRRCAIYFLDFLGTFVSSVQQLQLSIRESKHFWQPEGLQYQSPRQGRGLNDNRQFTTL
jgi:hypothetical protein